MTTTDFGTWVNHYNGTDTTVEGSILTALNGGDTAWIEALETTGALGRIAEAYREAINAALPDSVMLTAANQFYGPADETDRDFDGYPLTDDGHLDIATIIDDIDLYAIVAQYDIPMLLNDAAEATAKAEDAAAEAERAAIARARAVARVVKACDGNQSEAAKLLGIHPSRVSRLTAKATSEAGPASVEDAIRAAYARLVTADNEWVGLAPLRAQLTAYTRDEVDAGLRALAKVKGVHIIPVANFKSLIQEDHDAALLLGGYHSHAIAIEPQ